MPTVNVILVAKTEAKTRKVEFYSKKENTDNAELFDLPSYRFLFDHVQLYIVSKK